VREIIQLVDLARKEPVEAELFDEVTLQHFLEDGYVLDSGRPYSLWSCFLAGPRGC
jgi:hypothetical protein